MTETIAEDPEELARIGDGFQTVGLGCLLMSPVAAVIGLLGYAVAVEPVWWVVFGGLCWSFGALMDWRAAKEVAEA